MGDLHRVGPVAFACPRSAPLLATASLAAMLVAIRDADFRTLALYRGGFLVFAALTALVVAVVVGMPATPISRFLRMRWLVAVGLRSYSLYLWHWPVRVFITTSSGLDGPTLFAVRLALSAVLAELSFRLVEHPFRAGTVARHSGSRGALGYFVVLTVAAIVLVATVAAPRPLLPTNLADLPATFGTTTPHRTGVSSPTSTASRKPVHVELFGDSTAYMLAIGQVQHAGEVDVALSGDARAGCSLTQTDRVSGGQVMPNPDFCRGWQERWRADMRNDPHAHLAVMSGAWELLDQKTSAGVARFGTNAWVDVNRSALRAALDVLTADGRIVSLFEVPCYGTGDADIPLRERSDARRIGALNQIYTDDSRARCRRSESCTGEASCVRAAGTWRASLACISGCPTNSTSAARGPSSCGSGGCLSCSSRSDGVAVRAPRVVGDAFARIRHRRLLGERGQDDLGAAGVVDPGLGAHARTPRSRRSPAR